MAKSGKATISAADGVRRPRGRPAGIAAGLGALALCATAFAQTPRPPDAQQRLDEVREALERDSAAAEALARKAAAQARELEKIRAELRAAARAVQSHEAALDALENELGALERSEMRKRADLGKRRGQLGGTLAALQRLSLRPPTALLVSPGDPNDVVRSGLLMRTAVPEIEEQVRVLREDIAELAALRERIRVRRGMLSRAAVDLSREREKLQGLSDSKNAILQQTQSARAAAEARARNLRGEARSLEELVSGLREGAAAAAVRPRPRPGAPPAEFVTPTLAPANSSIAAARGSLTPPAHGRVVQTFGVRTPEGPLARGVVWLTRAEASVVAPWDGRIAFAGLFRRFGQILIIDHGEGYHTLIAGLGRIDAQVGQWVLAGEPLGRTDGAGAAGAGAETPSNGPRLYVEFRRDGDPIDPLPWLAVRTNRTG